MRHLLLVSMVLPWAACTPTECAPGDDPQDTACSVADTDTDTDSDADADSDADTDSDADADSDSDADADSDTDTGSGAPDADGDGYTTDTDCDDTDATISPGAAEQPYDGVDNDCDASTPDDDLDGDGYLEAVDCDDSDPLAWTGRAEIFDDGSDNDCDPATRDDQCQYQPALDFDPVVYATWDGSAVEPEYTRVMSTPMVADLSGDGVPDVIFTTYRRGSTSYWSSASEGGYVRVISGDDGRELHTFTAKRVMPNAGLAVGDVDGDGAVEVVAISADSELVVFSADGAVEQTIGGVVMGSWKADAPQLADLDQDGTPEVLVGLQAFDAAAGTLLWDAASTGCDRADNDGRHSIAVAADMDMGTLFSLELVTSDCVIHSGGGLMWGDSGAQRGFVGVGQFDADANLEIVVVSSGEVRVVDHDFSNTLWTHPIPGSSYGGPPVIGNFDGDPEPEIVVAGGAYLVVLDTGGQVLWQFAAADASSGVTGATAFDFDADGRHEIVYNDECFLRILDTQYPGTDARAVLYELPNTTWTISEYPVVADIDNDGNAEIVLPRNDDSGGSVQAGCSGWAGFDASTGVGDGIRLIEDVNDNWGPARRDWTQHAMLTDWGTRVSDDGGSGLSAPELAVTDMQPTGCPDLSIDVTIRNRGLLRVGPGVAVSVYRVDGATELLGTATTSVPLAPGASETVTVSWTAPGSAVGATLSLVAVVDDDGTGLGQHNECSEGNNSLDLDHVCSAP